MDKHTNHTTNATNGIDAVSTTAITNEETTAMTTPTNRPTTKGAKASQSKTVKTPKAAKTAKPAGKRGPKPKAQPLLRVDVLMKAAGIDNVSEFAERSGYSRQTVYTWMAKGLSYWRADELAIKLCGKHPVSVFGPVWYALDGGQWAVAA